MLIRRKNIYIRAFWMTGAFLLSIFAINPAIGLVLGAAITLILGNPVKTFTSRIGKVLLQTAVILLGFGMQFAVILKVGLASLWITFAGITLSFLIGYLIGRALNIERNLTTLITGGTAICGGSAIAAISPAIKASQGDTAVAMAVVFLLNAVGLVVFPIIGNMIGMSQVDFGLWAALAIHDTSSVVGASAAYGALALSVATTVKLTRALWIFPVALIAGKMNKSEGKPTFQWFLVGFLLAGLLSSMLPEFSDTWQAFATTGKQVMSGTLFLVGAALTRMELSKVGMKPLLMAFILWVIMSILSLVAILTGVWSIPKDIFM